MASYFDAFAGGDGAGAFLTFKGCVGASMLSRIELKTRCVSAS